MRAAEEREGAEWEGVRDYGWMDGWMDGWLKGGREGWARRGRPATCSSASRARASHAGLTGSSNSSSHHGANRTLVASLPPGRTPPLLSIFIYIYIFLGPYMNSGGESASLPPGAGGWGGGEGRREGEI